MSSLVFPTIPGITFNGRRTAMFNTGIQPSASGKETRIAYQQYPRVRFTLHYELLRNNVVPSELKKLVGLFEAMQGQFDTFLYTDPEFNTVTTEPFGTGDGATTAFQLIAKYQNTGGPGYPTLIQNLNGAPSIYDNGVLKTGGGVDYTLGPTGIVTFTAAPTTGHALTWTGSFYYRCRFTSDTLDDLSQFMNQLWALDTLEFVSVKL